MDLFTTNNFRVMHDYFKEIKDPFFILLLFGSHASGKARAKSDIDLLLIADNPKLTAKVKETVSLMPLDIHFIDIDTKTFLSMLKTTEFNVGKEAAKNNIILFGIEDYYRLINHA